MGHCQQVVAVVAEAGLAAVSGEGPWQSVLKATRPRHRLTPAGGCPRSLPRFVGYVSEFVVVSLIFGNVFGIGTEHADGQLVRSKGIVNKRDWIAVSVL